MEASENVTVFKLFYICYLFSLSFKVCMLFLSIHTPTSGTYAMRVIASRRKRGEHLRDHPGVMFPSLPIGAGVNKNL